MATFRVTWAGQSGIVEAPNDRDAWSKFCEDLKKSPNPKTGVVEVLGDDGKWSVAYKHDPKAARLSKPAGTPAAATAGGTTKQLPAPPHVDDSLFGASTEAPKPAGTPAAKSDKK